MSLLPLFFDEARRFVRPTRISDQHFGVSLDLDDLWSPIQCRHYRSPLQHWSWLPTACVRDSKSDLAADKDKFQVNIDVWQFKPDEIAVKVTGDNIITVEGKHEEKQDEHGYISRHFVRRYVLPEGHDIKNVVSSLSSDGILSIAAPRKDQMTEKERTISIQQTAFPSKLIHNKGQLIKNKL